MSEPGPKKRWTPTGILMGLIAVAWLVCPVTTFHGLMWFIALTVALILAGIISAIANKHSRDS
jgi:hypothetical protein